MHPTRGRYTAAEGTAARRADERMRMAMTCEGACDVRIATSDLQPVLADLHEKDVPKSGRVHHESIRDVQAPTGRPTRDLPSEAMEPSHFFFQSCRHVDEGYVLRSSSSNALHHPTSCRSWSVHLHQGVSETCNSIENREGWTLRCDGL